MKVSKPSVARAKLIIKEDKRRGEGPKLEKAIIANKGKRGRGKSTLSGVATEIAADGRNRRQQSHRTTKPSMMPNVTSSKRILTAAEVDGELWKSNPDEFIERYGKGPYFKTKVQYEIQWDDDARRQVLTALREAAKLADAVTVMPTAAAWQRWFDDTRNDAAAARTRLQGWLSSLQRLVLELETLKL